MIEETCQGLDPGDDNKLCNMINNKCIDTYKECEDYEGENQKIYESIRPLSDYYKKCVISGNACTAESKACSDFNFALEDSSICQSLTLKDDKKDVFWLIIDV